MSGAAVAVLLTSGCAAIVGGTYQPVSVTTQAADGSPVDGANCKLQNSKGMWYVTTPGSVTIHRGVGKLRVSCEKDGTATGSAIEPSRARGWLFGNILFGGLIGIGVDIFTGAGFDYPDRIFVTGKAVDPAHTSHVAAPGNGNAGAPDSIPPGPDLTAHGPDGLEHGQGDIAQGGPGGSAPSRSQLQSQSRSPKPATMPAPAFAPAAPQSPGAGQAAPLPVDVARDAIALPTVRRDVSGGLATMVAAHADMDSICNTSGPTPQVQILEPARHGKAGIRSGQFDAPDAQAAAACHGGKLYGTQIYYTAAANFHGADRLRYLVVTSTGRFTRVVDIDIR